MMVATPASPQPARRQVSTSHEGFLRHAGFRWLKIALISCAAAILGYFAADVQPRPNGGSWYGYLLGTIGALLIVWLALLGIRKRAMTRGRWSLKAWTSAHVYLGLALIVIATLHTGFQLGWNVHSLAYGLMLLVILSGIFGTVVYSALPAALSQNREEMTQGQMIDSIRAIDRQLHDAAQPLSRKDTDLVIAALAQNEFEQGLWRRLSGKYPNCATHKAIEGLGRSDAAGSGDAAAGRVEKLLIRRAAQLDRLRRHLRLKGLLEVWLYIHVPASVALLAALTAHVISVFYYW
jgi:hypothetical protein